MEHYLPWSDGAPGRIRTCGLLLRRQTLYPLSYGGARYICCAIGPRQTNASRRPVGHRKGFGASAPQPIGWTFVTPADLAELLKATAAAVLAERGLDPAALPPAVTVERPRNPEHGDYASNLALQLGKNVGVNPRELAGWLAEALTQADGIASAEVAGPGFINLRLEASAQGVIINNVIDAGHTYGNSDGQAGHKINLEFVSANPTGPIHIGGTRWAAVGDALGRLLTTQGADVVREYYFNDHGAQINRFANSLIAAAKGEPTPDDGYAGSYIADIAAQIVKEAPDALSQPAAEQHETFRRIGVDLM